MKRFRIQREKFAGVGKSTQQVMRWSDTRMLRHAVIAFLGCLYVALSVWIVGKQGQTYREGLRSDRLAAGAAEKPSHRAARIEERDAASAPAVPEIAAAEADATPSLAAVAPSRG